MASGKFYFEIKMQQAFPLLGFPNESNVRHGELVYQCWFGMEARIALWECKRFGIVGDKFYSVNLYRRHRTDKMATHQNDRYSATQIPIQVADAFEALLAIQYLIQKHLPLEVIDSVQAEADRGTAPKIPEAYPAMAQE